MVVKLDIELLEQVFEQLLQFYTNKNKVLKKAISQNKIIIKAVDDVSKEYLSNYATKEEIKNYEKAEVNVDGQFFIPNKERKEFLILFNKKHINEDLTFIEIIFHELEHLCDFYCLTTELCNSDYSKAKKYKYYTGFHYWTEYNAKKLGYKYYREYLGAFKGIDMYSEEIVDHIKNYELQYQIDKLMNLLNDHNVFWLQIYFSLQFLARYNVWEEIDNDYFKNGNEFPWWLNETFLGRIYELYDLLNEMGNFELAKSKFKDLEKIIVELNKVANEE